jgi:Plasmid encoded RepA protein
MMATPIRQRLLDLATDIATSPPEDLAFTHSVLAQTSLPTAKPPDGMLRWERRQGRATLLVVAGEALDPKTQKFAQLPLPYGPKARLLLMHLNSEAVRRQSPIIPVEDSMTAFFRRVMGRTQDGRHVGRLKAQLASLAAATFRLGIMQGDDRALQLDTKVVSAFDLWYPKNETQRVLWPSTLRLSLDYYESLTKFAVPLDERAIAALAHSAMALDIYCWLAQRLHRIPAGQPQFVPWGAIYDQFGQGYREVRKFRRDFLKLLVQVTAAYPAARLSSDSRGMTLEASQPPVLKRFVQVDGISTEKPLQLEGR